MECRKSILNRERWLLYMVGGNTVCPVPLLAREGGSRGSPTVALVTSTFD